MTVEAILTLAGLLVEFVALLFILKSVDVDEDIAAWLRRERQRVASFWGRVWRRIRGRKSVTATVNLGGAGSVAAAGSLDVNYEDEPSSPEGLARGWAATE